MAIRKYTKFEIANIKRTAESVNKFLTQRDKAKQKIEKLNKEIEEIQENIDSWETPIKNMTGGYTSEDLTNKITEEGKPAKYILKYPETVVPATEDIIEEELTQNTNFEVDDTEKVEEIEL